MDDGAADAVLQVLSTTDEALSTDEICARVGANRVRDVRIALRDLAEQGEVSRIGSDRWRGLSVPEPAQKPKPYVGKFTEDELRRARARHGPTARCPHCNKLGDIDSSFGWRRMQREDPDIVPQSWCFDCRFDRE